MVFLWVTIWTSLALLLQLPDVNTQLVAELDVPALNLNNLTAVIADPVPPLIADPVPPLISDPVPPIIADPVPPLISDPVPPIIADPVPPLIDVNLNNLTAVIADQVAQELTDQDVLPIDLGSCCYGEETFNHGDVVLSLPAKCIHLVCKDGTIDIVYFNKPGDCDCCEYNGVMYQSGDRIEDICIDMTCREGEWITKGYIDECCRRCTVKDDPHFVSFDDVAFDFHGQCNYSITQEDFSYASPYGVYGDFRLCVGTLTCVDVTTFTDSLNTVLTMSYPNTHNILVNNQAYTVTSTVKPVESLSPSGTVMHHPVLAWSHGGDCIRILGTQGLVVDYCMFGGQWRMLSIWAYPSLANKLNGLCGHFNFIRSDDLTHRDGSLTTAPPPTWLRSQPNVFGTSWLTNQQSDSTCMLPSGVKGRRKRREADTVEVDCPSDMFEEFLKVCIDLLSAVNYDGNMAGEDILNTHAAFCASDLCAMSSSGMSQEEIDGFKGALKGMLKNTLMQDAMTTPGAKAPEEEGTGGDNNGAGVQVVKGGIKVSMNQHMQVEIPQ